MFGHKYRARPAKSAIVGYLKACRMRSTTGHLSVNVSAGKEVTLNLDLLERRVEPEVHSCPGAETGLQGLAFAVNV